MLRELVKMLKLSSFVRKKCGIKGSGMRISRVYQSQGIGADGWSQIFKISRDFQGNLPLYWLLFIVNLFKIRLKSNSKLFHLTQTQKQRSGDFV